MRPGVCQCQAVWADGITGGILDKNCDFVMKNVVCESDLEM